MCWQVYCRGEPGRVLALILRHAAFLTRGDVTEISLTQAWAVQGNVSFATGAIFPSTKTDPVLWRSLLMETTGMLGFLHHCSVSKFSCQIFALGS